MLRPVTFCDDQSITTTVSYTYIPIYTCTTHSLILHSVDVNATDAMLAQTTRWTSPVSISLHIKESRLLQKSLAQFNEI